MKSEHFRNSQKFLNLIHTSVPQNVPLTLPPRSNQCYDEEVPVQLNQ